MRIWRVSNHANLSGIGGILASGRWHSKGRPILYAAEHPALALLEALVHLDRSELPDSFQLLGVDIPDALQFATLAPAELAANWAQNEAATRRAGDHWLREGTNLLMRVPTALVPHAWNVLVNPAHPDISAATISSIDRAPFDGRLS
ncbi:RES family NAD+ phosphorylase [Methylocapsa sp. S129]|uniref:RES family NAD+ phosphorylase n=1 Tax=Methylocapsa sp. S129 TaxID=1641869 RepID=UPI00131E219B|nr:RES family NAD+ phosphorylase [Methylocapsa sp. S129]